MACPWSGPELIFFVMNFVANWVFPGVSVESVVWDVEMD